jgi:hypothetical protein
MSRKGGYGVWRRYCRVQSTEYGVGVLSGRIGAQILYFVGVGRGKGRVLEQEHNDARRRLECSQVAEDGGN